MGNDFTDYLEGKRLAERSIESYVKYAESFIEWNSLETGNIHYKTLTDYIAHLRRLKHGARYINSQLCGVRHWLEWQKEKGIIKTNPAIGVQVKDIVKRLPHDLLSAEQLRNIYLDYKPNTLERARNRQLLGFLALQGLRTAEICRMEKSDIDLKKGVIRILTDNRAEGRILELQAVQLNELNEWMEHKQGLLFTTKSGGNPKWAVVPLMRKLATEGKIKSTNQLRASCIAHWAKSYGIRQAQYMAGHRYASSTERYVQADPEKLKKAVLERHPLDS
jgi:integrase/recombinase XerD